MMAIALDYRFTSPIATRPQVAALLGMRASTLADWTMPRGDVPMVHTVRGAGRFTVPLVGIAEAASLRALREGGMSMQQARQAADFIRDEYGDQYAIASPHLFTDGTEAFVRTTAGLQRLRDGQGAFEEVLREHLRPLIIGPDGFIEAYQVENFHSSNVTIDPRFNAGRMSFERNRIPLFIIAGALEAGEPPRHVAADYGLTVDEVQEVDSAREWLAQVA